MKKVFIRTPYNYDTDAASVESGFASEEPSLTQQHFKDECDINHILHQFNVTGILPDNPLPPRYGDFSGIGDYHTALERVRAATAEFDALPGAIRERFENDPANLIEFLNDDTNREEAISLGLVVPPEAGLPSSSRVEEPASGGAGEP